MEIVVLTVAIAFVFLTFCAQNEDLGEEKKRYFSFVGFIVIAGVILEFLGREIDGYVQLHRQLNIVKAAELSLVPMVPAILLHVINAKEKTKLISYILVVVNMVLEILSVFIKIIFYVDSQGIYHRAWAYPIYIIIYVIGIIILVKETINFSIEYQGKHWQNLAATVIFLGMGFAMQIVNSTFKTEWISLAIALVFYYIYYVDLTLQIDMQSGVFCRSAYDKMFKIINYDTAIFVIDINNFKEINDKFGHQAGDIYISKVAETIKRQFIGIGYCYRIGGDEFVVVLKNGAYVKSVKLETNYDTYKVMDAFRKKINDAIAKEREKDPVFPNVAIGAAYHVHGDSFALTMKRADERMYRDKAEYKKIQN